MGSRHMVSSINQDVLLYIQQKAGPFNMFSKDCNCPEMFMMLVEPTDIILYVPKIV